MKKRGARGRRKKANTLTKTLVATALVTGAAGTVEAVDESSILGGDFADEFALADALDVGTTEVTGAVDFQDVDFFKFSGLDPGEPFTLGVERIGGLFTDCRVLDISDSTTPLDGPTSLGGSPVSLTGTIPADGMLIFEASGGEAINYRVTLSAPSVGTRSRTVDDCADRPRGGAERRVRPASAQGSRHPGRLAGAAEDGRG